MAHNVALISLKQTLWSFCIFSCTPPAPDTINLVYDEVLSVKDAIKRSDSSINVQALYMFRDGEIRVAAYITDDMLQSLVIAELYSYREVEGVRQQINFVTKAVEQIMMEHIRDNSGSPLPEKIAPPAALICLNLTSILHVNISSRVWAPAVETIQFAYNEIVSLQEVLKRLDSKRKNSTRMNALDGEIREAAYKLEDVLDSHMLDSQIGDMGEVWQEINSFTKALMKMEEEYIQELDKPPPEHEDVDDEDEEEEEEANNIVGISDEIAMIKYTITQRTRCELGVISLVGEIGSGASILAKDTLDDPRIPTKFERLAWVTVGPKYHLKEILLSILSQIEDDDESHITIKEDEESLREYLCTRLKGTRYLIALDNVCDARVWEYLRRSLPDEYNGSRVLLTTSLEAVAQSANSFHIILLSLNREQSWHFFQHVVFNRHSILLFDLCPPELEDAGRKIVESCKGLPLQIAKVGHFLSKAEKTPEIWNKVGAERDQISVFKDEFDEMSEISKITENLQSGFFIRGVADDDVSSRAEYVEISHLLRLLKGAGNLFRKLKSRYEHTGIENILVLFGMAGIGKTTLAKKIFEDPSISHHFDYCIWLDLGPTYRSGKILEDILSQIEPNMDKIHAEGDEILAEQICTILSRKRCLIVLDNIWHKEPLHSLIKLHHRVNYQLLLTTRLEMVVDTFHQAKIHEKRFLNEEESWHLLRLKVFGKENCPIKLEKAGKIIAKNCDGLPLLVNAAASLLSQEEKNQVFWNKVATKKNLVFEHASHKILKVLYSSYEYLPQYQKACFLYTGIFPQKYEIPTSDLFNLWHYDGIFEQTVLCDFEELPMVRLNDLVSRSILMVGKKDWMDSRIQTCSLHLVFWYLCITEARKSKFFHVLNRLDDGLEEYIKGQHRLCIQNSVLFGIKKVYNTMASNSTTRAILCTGPRHQYQVPICFNLRLLKVLHALAIRFYEFPIDVPSLVYLKYLAITWDRKLPPAISKLRNLECLIVHQHHCTKLYGTLLYLPKEIWDMQKLKNLQVMGSNLPDPCGACLPNLTLLYVSSHSCTEIVLKGVPNLKKLRIWIELRHDIVESIFCFDHISHLCHLELLKCVVMNPELMSKILPPCLSISKSGLTRLSLNGLGYHWKYMTIISSLPNLKVLELQNYAFRGAEWVLHRGEFQELNCLLLEDTDLVYWRAEDDFKLYLLRLVIRHCYKLKKIPLDSIVGYNSIVELDDCNPSASVQTLDFKENLNGVHVSTSWEDQIS